MDTTRTEVEGPIEWDEGIDGPEPRIPRINRYYPRPRGVRAQLHEALRWVNIVPNRADRRSAAKQRGNKNA